jgi:hypothetical protein
VTRVGQLGGRAAGVRMFAVSEPWHGSEQTGTRLG